jgi:ABC-2 type transport system ATP-binding protein
MSIDDAIVTKGLTKDHGHARGIFNADLVVKRGSLFGLLGRNGAGKTTLIRTLLGLEIPTDGSAALLGLDFAKENRRILEKIGYVDEDRGLYEWMRVGEIVEFTRSFYPTWDDSLASRMLDSFHIDRSQKVGELSRGGKAELALLLALSHRPEILVLDEPTSGLDIIVRHEFLEQFIEFACDQQTTILFSSHILEDVEKVCDTVAFVEGGKILFQSPLDALREDYRRFVKARNPGKEAAFTLKDIFLSVVKEGYRFTPESPSESKPAE